jgi:hypothetical protein
MLTQNIKQHLLCVKWLWDLDDKSRASLPPSYSCTSNFEGVQHLKYQTFFTALCMEWQRHLRHVRWPAFNGHTVIAVKIFLTQWFGNIKDTSKRTDFIHWFIESMYLVLVNKSACPCIKYISLCLCITLKAVHIRPPSACLTRSDHTFLWLARSVCTHRIWPHVWKFPC